MKWLSIPLSILFLLFFACEEDSLQELNNSLIPQQDSRLIVRLTDNPGDFEEVNVNIQEFRVETVEEGWINLPNVNTGIYDLLALQNGVEAVLVDDGFPSGAITQIRLILGDENTVKVDGKVFPLQTPGAQQSGLKLKVNAELESGSSLSILLDFDACKSVHQAGDKYLLKPVIKAILPDGIEFDSDGVDDDGEDDDGEDDGDENEDGKDDDDDGDDDDGDGEDNDDEANNGDDGKKMRLQNFPSMIMLVKLSV